MRPSISASSWMHALRSIESSREESVRVRGCKHLTGTVPASCGASRMRIDSQVPVWSPGKRSSSLSSRCSKELRTESFRIVLMSSDCSKVRSAEHRLAFSDGGALEPGNRNLATNAVELRNDEQSEISSKGEPLLSNSL